LNFSPVSAGERLPRDGRCIASQRSATDGGGGFACAVGLLAACGRLRGNVWVVPYVLRMALHENAKHCHFERSEESFSSLR